MPLSGLPSYLAPQEHPLRMEPSGGSWKNSIILGHIVAVHNGDISYMSKKCIADDAVIQYILHNNFLVLLIILLPIMAMPKTHFSQARLSLTFSEDYPHKPPTVTFVDKSVLSIIFFFLYSMNVFLPNLRFVIVILILFILLIPSIV